MKCVAVYVKNEVAGILAKFKSGSYEFRYLPAYRRSREKSSVAYSLSKSRAVYRSEVLFPFFFGLLAEGVQKRLQCRALRIDENDHFSRLTETCRQGAIGAVYVLPRRSR